MGTKCPEEKIMYRRMMKGQHLTGNHGNIANVRQDGATVTGSYQKH